MPFGYTQSAAGLGRGRLMCVHRALVLFSSGFVLIVSVVSLTRPAEAAQITSFSYTVTGGAFFGPNLAGPITGGSMTYSAPPPFLSTPGSCIAVGACGSIASLILTGAAGTWSLLAPLQGGIIVTGPGTASIGFGVSLVVPATASAVFRSGGVTATVFLTRVAHFFGSTVYVTRAGGPYYHTFTLGNEVRTVVPEPGTAALLGLGLLLGLAGGSRGLAARARGSRRP